MLRANSVLNISRLVIEIMRFLHLLCWPSLFLLGTIILAACTPTAPSSKSNELSTAVSDAPDKTNSTWIVEIYITGGFAGIQRRIKISSSGETVVIDEEKDERVEFDLQQTELEELSKLVQEIEGLPQLPENSSCIDCFHYNIDLWVNGSQFQASYNDETLVQSGIKPLIVELAKLMNDTLDK